MKDKTKKVIINLVGVILLIVMFLVTIYLLKWKDYKAFLWFCYIAIPLIIIGILKRNSLLVFSQVIILMISDLLWIFDFVYSLLTGNSLLGITSYFYRRSVLGKLVTSQHFYTVPLSLFVLFLMKIKKNYKVLLISLVEIILIFSLTLILVPSGEVNCLAPNTCTSITSIFKFLPYEINWLIFMFLSTIFGYFIIISIPIFRNKKIRSD